VEGAQVTRPLFSACVAGALVSLVAAQATRAEGLPPERIARFADSFFSGPLESGRIQGAAFVVVDRESVRFARGYGFEDVRFKTPMDPATSRFRVGSLSKFVTATAALQLVEKGELALDGDVSRLVPFPGLSSSPGERITLAGLLTHTSGLDDRVIGAFARRGEVPESLAVHLSRRLPQRVLPPGEVIRYSNYGFALAGYLVEVASGLPFEAYVERNILRPLGMNHSGFLVPGTPPPALVPGYAKHGDSLERVPFDYFLPLPAGGFTTTALDISRLMRAHLSAGRFRGAQILSPASVQLMQSQQFTHAPRLPGVAYGLWERFENGRRSLQHGGAWNGYACLMLLAPEEGLGFFVGYDQFDLGLAQALAAAFLDEFLPARNGRAPAVAAAASDSAELEGLAGTYRDNWYSRNELDKLQSLFWQLEVRADSEGRLLVESPMDPSSPSLWRRSGPQLFENVSDDRLLSFRRNGGAQVSYLFIGSSAYERISWFETARAHRLALAPIALLLASAILRAGARSGRRDSYWRGAAAVALVQLVFLAGFVWIMAGVASSGGWALAYGLPPSLRIVLALGAIASLGGALLPVACIPMALGGGRSRLSIAHFVSVALAAATLSWLIVFYNGLELP
jgi:CubicO group peptidase (beta-lactamase class C family)